MTIANVWRRSLEPDSWIGGAAAQKQLQYNSVRKGPKGYRFILDIPKQSGQEKVKPCELMG